VAELQSNPHELVNRPKTTKLAKFSDPVWHLPLPAWLGGPDKDPDPRTVCLLITAAATSIEAEFSTGNIWWKDIYDAIIKCPDQAALSKSTKDAEHALDALAQRLLISRFPAFAVLSPGQIRTAAGFANLDLPNYLIRYAALTQVVATVNDQLLKVQSKEIPEIPTFYLDRDLFNQFDWGDASHQLGTIPPTPLRESASAREANFRAAGMVLELAALREKEPAKDSRADLANRSEQDSIAVAERLSLSAKEASSAQSSLDSDGRPIKKSRVDTGDSPFAFVAPDPLARAASLRGPPGVNPLDSVSAYHDPTLIAKLQSGVWPGVDTAFAVFTGSAAKPGNYTVTLDGNGGDMQFVSRASGASVPESPSDFSSVCKVIVANFATISPADADHLDRKLLGLVLSYSDMCDGDHVLLGAVVDLELKAYVYNFARGVPDYPLPDATERVYNHARRINRRNRERAARDTRDRQRRQPVAPDDTRKPPAKRGQPPFAFPTSGTATVGRRTKLVRTKAPGISREDCKNHRLGIPCAQAYATGDCTRRHLGAFGVGRDDTNASSDSDAD